MGPRRWRTGRGLNGAGLLREGRFLGAGPCRSGAVRGAWPPPDVGVAVARWAWPRRRGRAGPGQGSKGHEFESRTPRFRCPSAGFPVCSPSSCCPRTENIPGPPLQRPKPLEQPRRRRGPCPSWPYHPLLEYHLGWAFWGPFPALLLDGFSFFLPHVYISLTVMGDLSIPGPPGWGCSIHHPVTWAQSHTRGTRLDPTPHTGPLCWPSNSSRQGSQVSHLCAAELLSFSAHG